MSYVGLSCWKSGRSIGGILGKGSGEKDVEKFHFLE